jgi:NADPH-dependent glutamate synthase beta subunit-like oxidoreductase
VLFITSFGIFTLTSLQTFINNAHVGVDFDAEQIRQDNDAVVIATGATWPRDLKISGRDANGIHFAMEFLQVCGNSGTEISVLKSLIAHAVEHSIFA